MNNFKVKNPRKDLSFEIQFTKAYREARAAHIHPAEIEAACLRAQFPAVLHPIQDEDLIAGRMQMGLAGLGIQHQTGGFGFYINEEKVVQELEFGRGNSGYREDLHDLLTFWKGNSTNNIVLRNIPQSIRGAIFSDQWRTQPLPASPILRMAGAYVDFQKLIKNGLPGMLREVQVYRDRAVKEGGDVILFKSMMDVLNLLKEICLYYAGQADEMAGKAPEKRKMELKRMSSALKSLCERAPATMLEALQLVWIYSLVGPLIEFGRLDLYLADLYVSDIESGRLDESGAVELVKSYFRLIDHLDCETDGRVIIGGYGRENRKNADRFCLTVLEACRQVHEVLPQLTLRFSLETPEEVIQSARQCLVQGRTYPLLYNDDILVPGVMKSFKVDRARAETYVPLGCGEIELDHFSIGSPNGSINTLKILELTLRGGYDPMAGWHLGPGTKPLNECSSFDEFFGEYKKHLEFYVRAQAEFEKYEYEITGKMHPFMLVTMLYDGCLDRGKSIFNGGCAHLGGTVEMYGNVNAANSLAAVKKHVFQDKTISAANLIEALDNNFFQREKLRKQLMDAPKYGNDDDFVDSLFLELHDFMSGIIMEQASRVGLDSYLGVTINNAQNTTLGRWVGATPDGRKAGNPMANANNPAPGTDHRGLTAMMNSIIKPRHDNHAGMVSNLRFTRENFDQHGEKLWDIIDSYFDRGAAHAMITVVGKDDLRNAMDRPEEYRDLIVRVGGFSARFVDLKKDVQQEIYDRISY